MDNPLVSVICLCYNHEKFVREAIESVLAQSYKNIEVIVVDDLSVDRSRDEIEKIVRKHHQIRYLPLERNIGNCAAFNRGLALANGSFIVDFATDDVMLPERIEKQINLFATLDASYGVIFTDVLYIDEKSTPLYYHFDYLLKKKLIKFIPEGDIYSHILTTYFVSSPSMLVKREVFDQLQGYDESLAYEDFDFWVRSSRNFQYALLKEPLTKVRKTGTSLSTKAYIRGQRQLYSTFKVCKKAAALNKTEDEKRALIWRVRYEWRHAVMTGNYEEASMFHGLLTELASLNLVDYFIYTLFRLRLPVRGLRRLYHRLRY